MDKNKVLKMKREIASIAQDICNHLDGGEVCIDIQTRVVTDIKGKKSTIVESVNVLVSEEI